MENKIIYLNHYPQHIPQRCSILDRYISLIVPLCLASYETLKTDILGETISNL